MDSGNIHEDLISQLSHFHKRFQPRISENLAIGIDLGTTYSCVAVYKDGHIKVIANDKGNRITPSCVSFTPNGMLVGDDAKVRLTMNPENTVYEVKRLMGKSFDDTTVQEDMTRWPFDVVSNGGKPAIKVQHLGQTKDYSPEEISSHILIHMKGIAEKYLKTTVTKAVITIPAYFNENQRSATMTAAKLAGLEVLRIINEPTAAALAYQDQKRSEESKDVLVFDLGGGTFDVSVLNIEGDAITVSATSGNPHLGGADFDNRIVDYVLDEAKQKGDDISFDKSSREIMRLRKACETAKCNLAEKASSDIFIDDFQAGKDLVSSIRRQKFDAINDDLFKSTLKDVDQALEDAGLSCDDISEVVLVGGSTRVYRIRQLVRGHFKGKQLNKSIHPDEAVAYGAAIQAALLNGQQGRSKSNLQILDVTPLSLGVNIKGGLMSTIIKRNTNIPISKTNGYITSEDNVCKITFSVYQGERQLVKENTLLGQLDVEGIPPAPAGVEKIDCTFSVDVNGNLAVLAQIKSTGEEKHITIQHDKVRSNDADVKRMITMAEGCQQQDEEERSRILVINSLETYVGWMKYIFKTYPLLFIPYRVRQVFNDTTTWVNDNTNEEPEVYSAKERRLRLLCSDIDRKYQNPGTLPDGNPERTRYVKSSTRYSDID